MTDEIKHTEPVQAFPYRPPSKYVKEQYKHLFLRTEPIKMPLTKRVFDCVFAVVLLILFTPIYFAIWLAYKVEGMLDPATKGDAVFYYWAISGGKRFKKYKYRILKTSEFLQPFAGNNDWRGFTAEWNEQSRTRVGLFVKKYYLDELPQLFSILMGEMSFVGPRPLAEIHYKRDLKQGNVVRSLLKGGLLGLGHIKKGTDEMGDASFEYEYAHAVLTLSPLKILLLDLSIIYAGFKLVLKGGGY